MALFAAAAFVSEREAKIFLFVLISCLALAMSFGWWLLQWEFDLADEVYDGGDFLLVRHRGEE